MDTMAKRYKKKHEENEIEEINDSDLNLSKKELYDLEKKRKNELKEKEKNKIEKQKSKQKKKKKKKTYKTNLAGRIFAIVMLILMVGSVIATISYYFAGNAR